MHEGIRKLKLERFKQIGLKDLPPEVDQLSELTYDRSLKSGPYDCIIATALTLEEMDQLILWTAKDQLNPNGVLYILYPKKGNKRYDFHINRDDIFQLPFNDDGFYGQSDLKLNSMTAFDEVFTVAGLKRIVSREYKKPKVSQSIDDYRDRVDELKELLTPELVKQLDELTPGYQASWARYVLSGVQAATRSKRLDEMRLALEAGFKSIEMYKEELKKK